MHAHKIAQQEGDHSACSHRDVDGCDRFPNFNSREL